MKVRFAVAPGGSFDPDDFAAFVLALEARRFDTVWLSDLPVGDTVDPLVGLAFAAAATRRLKLGANVVPFGISPPRLAKDLAQIDRLSGGRLLLSLVPGVGQPGERAALGTTGSDRGLEMEEVMGLLRRWWAGETAGPGEVAIQPTPVQQPLELWLGGHGPRALERAGRLADGWLGATLTPEEAGAARRAIQDAAAGAGRQVDPEHFGMSIGYARHALPAGLEANLRTRRPKGDAPMADLAPVGAEALRTLVARYVEHGVSKFVLRPLDRKGPWDDELGWLAEVVLPLQT